MDDRASTVGWCVIRVLRCVHRQLFFRDVRLARSSVLRHHTAREAKEVPSAGACGLFLARTYTYTT